MGYLTGCRSNILCLTSKTTTVKLQISKPCATTEQKIPTTVSDHGAKIVRSQCNVAIARRRHGDNISCGRRDKSHCGR